jgi:uncharacterized protein with beta-barrel porin domain
LQVRLTAGVVGNIVSLQAQEIAQAAQRYAVLQAELEVSTFCALCELLANMCAVFVVIDS